MNIENQSKGAMRTLPQKNPQVLLLFSNAQDAREYRHVHGTGGWIFTNEEMTVLFPPDVTPSGIFNHPVTRKQGGQLIGSQ